MKKILSRILALILCAAFLVCLPTLPGRARRLPAPWGLS